MPSSRALLALAVFAASLAAGISPARAGSPPAVDSEKRVRACVSLLELAAPREVAERFRAIPVLTERRQRVIDALRSDVETKASRVRAVLVADRATEIRTLWSAGVVCANATSQTWDRVRSLRPSVGRVFEDPPRTESQLDDAGQNGPNDSVAPEAPLITMRVPELWARGITGDGVVVAHLDTGMDLTHQDLADKFWINEDEIDGNSIDDDGNGYVDDWRGWNFSTDTNDVQGTVSHGTKTAGLLVGDGTLGSQTGVAPNAKLMLLRRGSTESQFWEASQYAIEAGAELLMQASSFKWSFVPPPDYATWRRQAESELAVGMLHVNSGGNTGTWLDTDPVPYNIAAPANCPPPWLSSAQPQQGGLSSVVTVGNVDSRSLEIAQRSPYGPSEWTDIIANVDPAYPYPMPLDLQDYPHYEGSGGLGKPDLVAPGDASLTTHLLSTEEGDYVVFDGTSAAAPRVAGVLALMKQVMPTATPAELTEALLTSARDAGPVGWDARYGSGIVDAQAAVDALGPTLRVADVQIVDAGSPTGDGDGDADEGELDSLIVTIENTGTSAIEDVEVVLHAIDGVAVRDPYAAVGTIGAGQQASSMSGALSLEFLAGSCGGYAEIEFELRAGGDSRRERAFVRVGSESLTALIATDFEAAAGFSTSGSATGGAWVRQAPVGTQKDGQQANPAQDASASGTLAWVTGNGSTDPDAADVDGGETILTSPVVDASSADEVRLRYARWFFGNHAFGDDELVVEASTDGISWTVVERVSARDNAWRVRDIVLSDLINANATTRVRFRALDVNDDDTVEAAIDDFDLSRVDVSCSVWNVPGGSPSSVGDTLLVSKIAGGHLELIWDAPSTTGGSDPARGYDVTSSMTPDGSFTTEGQPLATSFVVVDGQSGAETQFFLVDSLSS